MRGPPHAETSYTGAMRRLDSILVGAIGVLIVHQLAYTASATLGYETSIAHGHLALAWMVSSLGALIALATAISRSLRARNHAAASTRALVRWIGGGYVAMEALERTYDGAGALSLVSEPAFWLGVVAAPLVAVALRSSLDNAVRAVAAFIQTIRAPKWRPARVVAPTSFRLLTVQTDSVSASVSRRGPPVVR